MHGMNLYNVLRAMPFKLITCNVGDVDSIGNIQGFGKTNSMPYFAPAASSFSISLYETSTGGGNVMAGAGTLHSLKYPSPPAGVSSTSIRICSDSISNECTTFRGRKIIDPGVPLIVWPPTEADIAPSRI